MLNNHKDNLQQQEQEQNRINQIKRLHQYIINYISTNDQIIAMKQALYQLEQSVQMKYIKSKLNQQYTFPFNISSLQQQQQSQQCNKTIVDLYQINNTSKGLNTIFRDINQNNKQKQINNKIEHYYFKNNLQESHQSSQTQQYRQQSNKPKFKLKISKLKKQENQQIQLTIKRNNNQIRHKTQYYYKQQNPLKQQLTNRNNLIHIFNQNHLTNKTNRNKTAISIKSIKIINNTNITHHNNHNIDQNNSLNKSINKNKTPKKINIITNNITNINNINNLNNNNNNQNQKQKSKLKNIENQNFQEQEYIESMQTSVNHIPISNNIKQMKKTFRGQFNRCNQYNQSELQNSHIQRQVSPMNRYTIKQKNKQIICKTDYDYKNNKNLKQYKQNHHNFSKKYLASTLRQLKQKSFNINLNLKSKNNIKIKNIKKNHQILETVNNNFNYGTNRNLNSIAKSGRTIIKSLISDSLNNTCNPILNQKNYNNQSVQLPLKQFKTSSNIKNNHKAEQSCLSKNKKHNLSSNFLTANEIIKSVTNKKIKLSKSNQNKIKKELSHNKSQRLDKCLSQIKKFGTNLSFNNLPSPHLDNIIKSIKKSENMTNFGKQNKSLRKTQKISISKFKQCQPSEKNKY